MRTHEKERMLNESEEDDAREVELLVLKTLADHPLTTERKVVASLVGLSNALLTVATRLQVEKESFFDLIRTGWDYYQEQALNEDDDDNGRVH